MPSVGNPLPLLLCLVLLLFLCSAAVDGGCGVCGGVHAGPALEQTPPSLPFAAPPPDLTWGFALMLTLEPMLVARPRFRPLGRASPAELQRFLF